MFILGPLAFMRQADLLRYCSSIMTMILVLSETRRIYHIRVVLTLCWGNLSCFSKSWKKCQSLAVARIHAPTFFPAWGCSPALTNSITLVVIHPQLKLLIWYLLFLSTQGYVTRSLWCSRASVSSMAGHSTSFLSLPPLLPGPLLGHRSSWTSAPPMSTSPWTSLPVISVFGCSATLRPWLPQLHKWG